MPVTGKPSAGAAVIVILLSGGGTLSPQDPPTGHAVQQRGFWLVNLPMLMPSQLEALCSLNGGSACSTTWTRA